MNQLRAIVSDAELCAYLDDELSAERRNEVEGWLGQHPEARAKLAAWRRQENLLRASFGRIAQEPLPAHLTAPLQSPQIATITPAIAHGLGAEPALRAPGAFPSPQIWRRAAWRRLGLAVLCLASVAGLLASGTLQELRAGAQPQTTISPAIIQSGHLLVRHASEAHAAFAPLGEAVMDVKGADPASLAESARRSGLHVRLPGAVGGLQPLGLRLTPGEGGLAGLVLYQSEKAGPVSLYVSRGSSAHPGIVLRDAPGAIVATFAVDGLAYAVTGSASRDQMVDWASAMRATLVQPRSLRGS